MTETPTSEGVADMLSRVELKDHRVGLQLYPDKDHSKLIAAIASRGAVVEPVLPYVYDAQAADANIVSAIDEMNQGRVDAIALTSSGQVRRLIDVAKEHGLDEQLRTGLARAPKCVGWSCCLRRVEGEWPAHGYLSCQRCLLHEATDQRDGIGAQQIAPTHGARLDVNVPQRLSFTIELISYVAPE